MIEYVNIIIVLLIIATAMLYWGQLNKGEIHIGPIMGFVIGALYSYQEFEDEKIIEHQLQCCILFISITVIWEKPMNG